MIQAAFSLRLKVLNLQENASKIPKNALKNQPKKPIFYLFFIKK